jgi:hypothetical protein
VKPEDFPVGSLASRAAARAEARRRQRIEDDTALIVIWTGMPRPAREYISRVENKPGYRYYKMPDGSIVEVHRNPLASENLHRGDIRVEQYWPDGRTYDGDCLIEKLSDISLLGDREYK